MDEKEKKRDELTQEAAASAQPQAELLLTMTGQETEEKPQGEEATPAPGSGGGGGGTVTPPTGGTWYGSGDGIAGRYYPDAPGYTDPYQQDLRDAMAAYRTSQKPFTYYYTSDPNYQQYAQVYAREGRRAAQDAVGQVSARTGGLASSYAASAATQAEQYYAQQLADKVPELRQLAYQMYRDELSQRQAQVEFYTGLQDRDRSWFVTSQLEPYYQERSFDYGVYRDGVADAHWQQSFDYQKERDAVADSQWRENFNYKKQRDRVADEQWQMTHW